jgi:NAD(P)-dependent dehydrogenase (short-subunit alcohol dehydrogenase family)
MKRTAIVTGAYGAIGKGIAEGIASAGYKLVMVGRNEIALEKCRNDLVRSTGNHDIYFRVVDLSRKLQVEDFSRSWDGPLHILINNAAVTPRSRLETPEGIEMQFATNVLGYLWMALFFSDHMAGLDDARVVNVASYWAGDMDMNDLEFKARRYNNNTAYRQSKQANRMLTRALVPVLGEKGIFVLAAHPGDVNSRLSNNLGYGGWESPEQGASNPLYCALDPSLKGVSGKYFEHKEEVFCPFASDHDAVNWLLDICMVY